MQLGAALNFDQTEYLLAQCDSKPGARTANLPRGFSIRRTHRELHLCHVPDEDKGLLPAREYQFAIPGQVHVPELDLLLTGKLSSPSAPTCSAILRRWRPGDRVALPHSRGAKRVKEILDRLEVRGEERKNWPVVEIAGEIVWMRGVQVNAPEFLFVEQATRALMSDENHK
jgi:tRNA(Ile)-lysidine synthetase-like protein